MSAKININIFIYRNEKFSNQNISLHQNISCKRVENFKLKLLNRFYISFIHQIESFLFLTSFSFYAHKNSQSSFSHHIAIKNEGKVSLLPPSHRLMFEKWKLEFFMLDQNLCTTMKSSLLLEIIKMPKKLIFHEEIASVINFSRKSHLNLIQLRCSDALENLMKFYLS